MVGRGWCRGVGKGRILAKELKHEGGGEKIHSVYKRLGKLDEIMRTH